MTANGRTLDELFAVAHFLKDFSGRWWMGGGWAIDSWIGNVSREHEDIEICVLRSDQEAVHKYCVSWDFYTPVNNEWSRMPQGKQLDADGFMLQVRRTTSTPITVEGIPPEFEFILNDVDDGDWVFKFDPGIRLPLEDIYCNSLFGFPVTAPEIVLLHKAWYPGRPKDEHDFANALDHLNLKQRHGLSHHLGNIRPNHPRLSQLAS